MVEDVDIARRVVELDRRFYSGVASSFAASRHGVWPGQRTCVRVAVQAWEGSGRRAPMRVADVACGNMRLAACLAQEAKGAPLAYTGIDVTDGMRAAAERAGAGVEERFVRRDVIACLDGEGAPGEGPLVGVGPVDAAFCFAFFHHVPLASWRRRLLADLLAAAPGGVTAVSLWRFADDEAFRAKAAASTRRALETGVAGLAERDLGPGDFLLDWQGRDRFRFCHSFSEDEVCEMARACPDGMRVERFSSDGRTRCMNDYLVFLPDGR